MLKWGVSLKLEISFFHPIFLFVFYMIGIGIYLINSWVIWYYHKQIYETKRKDSYV